MERGYHTDSEVMQINVKKNDLDIGFKDFEFIKPLGQGAYGGVYLVKKKTTNDLYALKVIDCCQEMD